MASVKLCDYREDQALIVCNLYRLNNSCSLRTKLSSAKVKRINRKGRQIPRTDWKVGFSFLFYFFPELYSLIVEEQEERNTQMFEPSLVIMILNITSTFYVYPLKREGKCVLEFHTLLCCSSYFMFWSLCYQTVYYNLFYYSMALVGSLKWYIVLENESIKHTVFSYHALVSFTSLLWYTLDFSLYNLEHYRNEIAMEKSYQMWAIVSEDIYVQPKS